MVYDASEIPLLDAAIQQVASNAVPDAFFDRDPAVNLSHKFVHNDVHCRLTVASGSTALRHHEIRTVGSHYSLHLVELNSTYFFCVVEPSNDRALNRKCAIHCLHLLKTTPAVRFMQRRAGSPEATSQ